MKLSERQKRILAGVYLEREHYAALPRPLMRSDSDTTQWCHTLDCQAGIVNVNPSVWLGFALTHADHVSTSRNYRQLEDRGLIVRERMGFLAEQTSHIRLTSDGEAVAKRLVADGYGPERWRRDWKESLSPSAARPDGGAEPTDQEGPKATGEGAADV